MGRSLTAQSCNPGHAVDPGLVTTSENLSWDKQHSPPSLQNSFYTALLAILFYISASCHITTKLKLIDTKRRKAEKPRRVRNLTRGG